MSTRFRFAMWVSAVLLAVMGGPTAAWAYRGGISTDDCSGCHRGTVLPTITLTASPATFNPGQKVTLTVTVSNANGGPGGISLFTGNEGTFTLGSDLRVLSGRVTHSAPKAPTATGIVFTMDWTPPAQPGGTQLEVAAVASNGNGQSGAGDGATKTTFSLVYGCAGSTFYKDGDNDGFGSDAYPSARDCAKPPGYSVSSTDCDDNSETVYPGATEGCNLKDDDCDGQVDDGAPQVTLYPDADGDGHGVPYGLTVQGCGQSGYAPNSNDCNDRDPSISPSKAEVCNYRDDNCDGQIDEKVFPICGVGMCRRKAGSCDPASCVPSDPLPEVCNFLDDDCDGEADNNCIDGGTPSTPPAEGDASPLPASSGSCTSAPIGGASVAWALLSVLLRRRRE